MSAVPENATILGSTIVFAPYSLEQALEGLAAAGYRNCEIGAVKGWFEHIDPDTATDKEIAQRRVLATGPRAATFDELVAVDEIGLQCEDSEEQIAVGAHEMISGEPEIRPDYPRSGRREQVGRGERGA